jgi:SAM-dependent methyltransferase
MANESQLIISGILETQRLSAKTAQITDLMRERPTQATDSQIGEHFAALSRAYGQIAAAHLFRSEWCYVEPEWFDHRLHLLDPETHFNDFWTASSDNVISVLPLGGRLLDLCSGDGFYDYWFYRHRAQIVGIEKNQAVFDFACLHHGDMSISYELADVLTYQPKPEHFDTVVIRGAIEHFTRDDQQRIFRKAWTALKEGGWFCGDTPAKRGEETKALEAHEYEWRDEQEMREELSCVFKVVECRTLISRNRTTLLWKCQK